MTIRNLSLAMLELSVCVIILELTLCRHLPRKRHSWGYLALCLALLFIYCFLLPIENLGVFLHLPIFLIALLMLFLCYEVSVQNALYCWTASCTIYQIVSLLDSILTLFWPKQLAHFGLELRPNWLALAVNLGCFLAVYAVMSCSLMRRMQDIGLWRMATLPVVIISLVMVLVNHTMGMIFELYAAPNASPLLHLMEYTWNLLCCFFCLSIQFHMFQISKKEEELTVARQLILEQEKQYRISKSTMDAVNRKSHDLKYQLMELAAGQTGSKSKEHIQEAMELVESFDSNIHTGNDTLDVIFTEKSQYCRQLGITFVCMIDGKKLSFMDATDQYVLFGNMIDNAINAVVRLPEGGDRTIYVNVYAEKHFLHVQTENRFVGPLDFKNGLPRTSTGDELNHGYGMTSIKMLCDKYGGGLHARADDHVFYLKLIFPL